jgi:hypothetical protein
MDSPESKRKSDDRTSNPILKCRKNAIVNFFASALTFAPDCICLEAGYVMICCSSWISTQKRTPSGVAAPDGVFLFFLPSTAFFIDKAAACYYNNVVKMASLCGFAAVQNK